MSARDTILKAITANKPALVDLPAIDLAAVIQYNDLLQQFKTVLQSIGGGTVELQNISALNEELKAKKANGYFVLNRIAALEEKTDSIEQLTAHELAAVDTAYLQGSIAVAENGAIWLDESAMGNRLLPFICQHLVILIDKKNIVATMHHAYHQIKPAKEGFGVFLAGPSKTADIEQSLVIGAHGARSLIVYILNN
jgi:L-lactate dehydrogenase complex protein LldG